MAGAVGGTEGANSLRYRDPRAHAIRERYLTAFGGAEIPVPVERIAEDLLGLRIEEADLGECSGMLIPSERLIRLNAAEAHHNDEPIRRHRFTIAHEVGHWICHCLEGRAPLQPEAMCRSQDMAHDVDRSVEREANVFAAELLMPEESVRRSWLRSRDPDQCAQQFGVSPLAMRWRLHGFGLADRPRAIQTS